MKKHVERTGIVFVLATAWLARSARPADAPSVRLPSGFRIELYADSTLANDIQAMTLDARGRVVVTGPGYVKTLLDDGPGTRASRSITFATPKSGGQGLCFDGDDLYITADGWLSRYRDADGDDRSDGPPERISPLTTGEHGGHAIRKGPDGSLYVIGGNDAGIDARHVTSPNSPVLKPVAGAIVRLSADLKTSEVVAHGFRNPYDFDFDSRGDIVTYDSDCERDEFLPWYTPTRLFRVAIGGHHGWRLKGYTRSFARRPDQFDAIPPLLDLGRGSPTGVVAYRHTQFPPSYRDGVFLCDWTFGRITFVGLHPRSPARGNRFEVFLDPIGSDGFAPTDACVGPDGSLFVSIGGRRTRGAVYRISYEGGTSGPASGGRKESPDVQAVLTAPQPLDAWSRKVWVPAALRLGAGPFETALRTADRPEAERMRAVEVLVELFDGLSVATAEAAWASATDPLRARIAWAIGRRRSALERAPRLVNDRSDGRVAIALLSIAAAERMPAALESLTPNDDTPASDFIPAVEQVVRRWSDEERRRLAARAELSTPSVRLAHALIAFHLRPDRETGDRAIRTALVVLDQEEATSPARLINAPGTTNPAGGVRDRSIQLRLDALRLLVVALGDWGLDNAASDVFAAYTLGAALGGREALLAQIRGRVSMLFPSGIARLDEEASRLLAMIGDPRETTRRAVVARWTDSSNATSDLHDLIVYTRLLTLPVPSDRPKVAEALCRLDGKLGGTPGRIKQSWNLRVGELFADLSRRDPGLVDALVARNDFVRMSHAEWAARVDAGSRRTIADAFFKAAREGRDESLTLDATLLDLFDCLPREEVADLIRRRPDSATTSEAVLIRLAREPRPEDRPRFLDGLRSPAPGLIDAALQGLNSLPVGDDPSAIALGLKALRRLVAEPRSRASRERLAAWLARELRVPKLATEPVDSTQLIHHYAALFETFIQAHPNLASLLDSGTDPVESARQWKATLAEVDWSKGTAERGAKVFRDRQCESCHGGGGILGPDLAGASRRFSRDDLFAAIVDPARDVAPAYRPMLVELKDGRTRLGFLVFESGDGLMLQTGPSTVERIPGAEISSRGPGDGTLMPSGLLQGARAGEVADLYAYLKSL